MSLLVPTKTDIRQFRYADDGTFIADISETNGLGRVYDDACDEGLTVVGRTGRHVVFIVHEQHRDAEGDTTHWSLRSLDGQYSMVLFND